MSEHEEVAMALALVRERLHQAAHEAERETANALSDEAARHRAMAEAYRTAARAVGEVGGPATAADWLYVAVRALHHAAQADMRNPDGSFKDHPIMDRKFKCEVSITMGGLWNLREQLIARPEGKWVGDPIESGEQDP